jgi:hypothetical protein
VLAIAWELRGRELLIVTPERLEVRKEIGRFARTKLYDAALVRTVEEARVPHDEDEKPRKDFCLKVLYDDTTLRVGEGMSEREAEYVASVVLQRIRPRSWWGEDEPAVFAPVPSPQTYKSARGPALFRNLAFPAIVIAVLVWLGVAALTGGHSHSSSQPTTTAAAPSGDPFAAARTYASASTAYSLSRAQTLVIGLPICHLRGMSREWTCTVRARASLGPLRGPNDALPVLLGDERRRPLRTRAPAADRRLSGQKEWSRRGSNPWPSACHADALPAELRPQGGLV